MYGFHPFLSIDWVLHRFNGLSIFKNIDSSLFCRFVYSDGKNPFYYIDIDFHAGEMYIIYIKTELQPDRMQ